jgi:phage terminase large subunit
MDDEKDFIATTNLRIIAKMKKFIRIVQGGSSAGKTYSIVPLLINYAIENDGKMISIVAESMPHLKRGAMRDFEKIMRATGRWIEGAMNKQYSTYTFSNGSRIEFFSADQPDKLRGARRNVLFINEANNVNWEAFHQLFIRTSDHCYIDFNPVAEFWAHTELKERDDADFVILTYKGNEGCPVAAVNELQRAEIKAKNGSPYWVNFVDVYVNGKVGQLTGTVYENWTKVDALPSSARLLGYGLDFGFSNDPTALIGFYRYNGSLYMNEEFYSTGFTNSDLNQAFKNKGISKVMDMICDSAEPKSIEELRRYGWNAKATKKGKDSILYGIDVLQAQTDILVPASSVNLIKELRNYVWEKDGDGHKSNKPIDKWNHGLDAARYFAMMKLRKMSDFFVT